MNIKKLAPFLFAALFSCNNNEDNEPIVIEGDVLINEISSNGDDWIELYNTSNQVLDISSYYVYDDPEDKYQLPLGVTIQPNGYLIIKCDGSGTGLNTHFKLSSQGEELYLENNSGQLINKVEFPALDEGQTYARFPDGADGFTVTGAGTQGESNGGTQSPIITAISRNPSIPSPSNPIVISAEIKDDSNLSLVKLHYMIDGGGFTEVDMLLNQGKYEATIPKLDKGGKVEYFIEARDDQGMYTLNPASAPDVLYSILITTEELPALLINEFMAANKSCCPDPENVEDYDDWIEIYNSGIEAVDIGGMYVSANNDNPFKYQIPTTDPSLTTIQPGGYLVLWADGQMEQGVLHVDIKLSAEGEDVGLYYIDGRTIDQYTFGAQTQDVSSGRLPNGSETWKTFPQPTPGSANQ
ncbi:MAG TPA: lamin tail domain-containing protein [Cytophagales bacterium]|nr:lamin tail domain-containing protein [Cytophagales bacterium]